MKKVSPKERKIVQWLDKGFYPPFIGFCPSAEAWTKIHKDMGCDPHDYPTTDASCVMFTNTKLGKEVILVTVGDHIDKKYARKDPFGVAYLIVHECVHVWQHIREAIGEKNPGYEQEAYAIHALTQQVTRAYSITRVNIIGR